jgi:hypothetical protein
LPCPIALELFKTIAGRNTKVFNLVSDLQLAKLASSDRLHVRESRYSLAIGEGFGVGAPERRNHD